VRACLQQLGSCADSHRFTQKLLKRIPKVIRVLNENGEQLEPSTIEAFVAKLDEDDRVWERITPATCVQMFNLILHSSYSLAKDRGLYLLTVRQSSASLVPN
jgi:hypothetical protein